MYPLFHLQFIAIAFSSYQWGRRLANRNVVQHHDNTIVDHCACTGQSVNMHIHVPSKHKALNQCCLVVGTTLQTSAKIKTALLQCLTFAGLTQTSKPAPLIYCQYVPQTLFLVMLNCKVVVFSSILEAKLLIPALTLLCCSEGL